MTNKLYKPLIKTLDFLLLRAGILIRSHIVLGVEVASGAAFISTFHNIFPS